MRGQPHSQAKQLPPPSIVDGSASPAVAGPTRTTSEVRRIGPRKVKLGHTGRSRSGVIPKGAETLWHRPQRSRTGDGGCELPLGNASVGRYQVRSRRRRNPPRFWPMYFKILTPTGNLNGPVYTQRMLQTLHRANINRDAVTFRIDSHHGQTQLGIDCPPHLKSVVLHELQDSYPGLVVRQETRRPPQPTHEWFVDIRKSPDVLTLRSTADFSDDTNKRKFADPLAGILTAMQSGRSGRLSYSIELTLQPATKRRLRNAARVRNKLNCDFRPKIARDWYLTLTQSSHRIARTTARVLARLTCRQSTPPQNGQETDTDAVFECRLVVRAAAGSDGAQIARKRVLEICGAFSRFNTSDCRFEIGKVKNRLKRQRTWLVTAARVCFALASANRIDRQCRPSLPRNIPRTRTAGRPASSV